jgi:hypothetical protein
MVLSLVIAVVISAGAIYFAVAPLLKPGKAAMILDDDKLTTLLERKDATLKAIKDLEFDYRVGKMDHEDFTRLDQRLRRQAIGYIQQIEKLAPASSAADDQLEAMIARMRQVPTNTPAVPVVAPVPTVAGNGHSHKPAAAARFCTNCGQQLETGHKFCAHCGTPVATPETVAAESA